ncbi:MAG: tannase/feruloyl esterase family alpha/beta hydrolase [Oliverpabstia sp.]
MKKEIDENIKKIYQIEIAQGTIQNVMFQEAYSMDAVPGLKLTDVPDCYKVQIELNPSDVSCIKVELWLPDSEQWNGKYLATGNGGGAGQIVELSLAGGVGRGYATANTDLGTAPDYNDLVAAEERWIDFGYRATHLMTLTAKKIIREFYGREAKYSYFFGGSTGGQQAMSEAQKYPEEYDGIIAVEPAMNRVRLHIQFIWNLQAIHKRKEATFDQKTADAVTDRIAEVYGTQAGNHTGDRFLADPEKIEMDVHIFDEMVENETLAQGQYDALRLIYGGPVNPKTGERIFRGMVPGSEAVDMGLVKLSDAKSFAKELCFPTYWVFGKDYDVMQFDFHTDYETMKEKLSKYLDATNPNLGALKKAGTKLLLISGTADPAISYTDTMDYYRKVEECEGSVEKTRSFLRYFVIPGFGHTINGPEVQDIGILGLEKIPKDPAHDVLAMMEAWVEKEEAPEVFTPAVCRGGSLFGEVVSEREAVLINR